MQEQEHAGEQPQSHSSQPQSASVAQGEVELVETVEALFVNMLSATGEDIMRKSNNARVMMAQMINSRLRGDGKLTTEQYNICTGDGNNLSLISIFALLSSVSDRLSHLFPSMLDATSQSENKSTRTDVYFQNR